MEFLICILYAYVYTVYISMYIFTYIINMYAYRHVVIKLAHTLVNPTTSGPHKGAQEGPANALLSCHCLFYMVGFCVCQYV